MNIRTIIISIICTISSHVYTMESSQSFDAMIVQFRAKNPKKVVIIDGVLYTDPSSPAALAARAAYEEKQRQAEIRQHEEYIRQQEQQNIATRAMQNIPTDAAFEIGVDQRSESSLRTCNKENPSSFY